MAAVCGRTTKRTNEVHVYAHTNAAYRGKNSGRRLLLESRLGLGSKNILRYIIGFNPIIFRVICIVFCDRCAPSHIMNVTFSGHVLW